MTKKAKVEPQFVKIPRKHLNAIWKRVKGRYDDTKLCLELDLAAANVDVGLDTEKLVAFDDFNLFHDIYGIYRHMDRDTGKLTGYFRPRCAISRDSRTACTALD